MGDLREIRGKYRKDNDLDLKPALVGKADGTVYDDIIPNSGRVYVREKWSDTLGMPYLIRGPISSGIKLTPGLPVLIGRNKGEPYIKFIDAQAVQTTGQNPLTAAQPTNTYQQQQTFQTLLVTPTNPPGTLVHVSGWTPFVGGTLYEFPPQNVDLGSLIPSAGQQRYATIFVKNDYATTEIKGSTVKISMGPETMTLADAQENVNARTAGSTPVWSVWLHDGITTIGQTEISGGRDHRQVVNT